MSSFLEHAAVRVENLDWHIYFFTEILGMTVERTAKAPDGTQNVWLNGGIQLTARQGVIEKSSVDHLGIVTEDLSSVMEKIRCLPAIELIPNKPVGTWVRLPEGLVLELFEQKDQSVERVLAIVKR